MSSLNVALTTLQGANNYSIVFEIIVFGIIALEITVFESIVLECIVPKYSATFEARASRARGWQWIPLPAYQCFALVRSSAFSIASINNLPGNGFGR